MALEMVTPAIEKAANGAVERPSVDAPDLDDPLLYLNRELTWLEFNRRVLREAEDERNPLLERLKFLAIAAMTLDEFFMKRIGGLKQQVAAGVTEPTVDGSTPQQQIAECYARDSRARTDQRRVRPACCRCWPGTTFALCAGTTCPKPSTPACASTTSTTSFHWSPRWRSTPRIRSRSSRTCR